MYCLFRINFEDLIDVLGSVGVRGDEGDGDTGLHQFGELDLGLLGGLGEFNSKCPSKVQITRVQAHLSRFNF